MPQISYKELAKLLKRNGCRFIRQANGSHEIWFSTKTNRHFTLSKTIKADGTYHAVLKQAGIKNS